MFSSVLNKNLNWEILLIYFFTYFQNCRFKGVGGGVRAGGWQEKRGVVFLRGLIPQWTL